jgi:uncharacterized protein (TIGR02588 family)
MKLLARHRKRDTVRGLPERVTLGISVAVVIAMLGTLTALNLQAGSSPAALRVTPDFAAAFEKDGSWYLPVEVTNTGDQPTDTVTVALERATGAADPEVAELDFTFVAGGETVSGWAAFDERPTAATTHVDPVSYTDP